MLRAASGDTNGVSKIERVLGEEGGTMTAGVEHHPAGPNVEELILLLVQTTSPHTIEEAADQLGDARDRRAIRPLLIRLSDPRVQEEPNAEHAVCRALTNLGVMRGSGELSHSLRPRRELPDDVVETIRELVGVLPGRYFGTQCL